VFFSLSVVESMEERRAERIARIVDSVEQQLVENIYCVEQFRPEYRTYAAKLAQTRGIFMRKVKTWVKELPVWRNGLQVCTL
jgi:hypothetical protein